MTLTEFSYYSRRFAPIMIIFILVVTIFYFSVRVALIVHERNKEAEIPPTVFDTKFNEILSPLSEEATPSSRFSYLLDTIDGTPITVGEAGNVYFLPEPAVRLGYNERVVILANRLGFNTSVTKPVLNNEGTASTLQEQRQSLEVDIRNFNFTYEYDFENDPALFQNTRTVTENEVQNRAIDFLTSVNRYPDELARGPKNIIFLRYDQLLDELIVVPTAEEANMYEVDFEREELNGFPVFSKSYYNSHNYVVIVFTKESFKIVKAQVRFFERSDSEVGTYPLRTGEQAWADLKEGRGKVISYATPEVPDVNIKKMFLGYIDSPIYTRYLQQVFVFLGDNNFVGYVPAVSSQWILENSEAELTPTVEEESSE